jgi:hypothetical protein
MLFLSSNQEAVMQTQAEQQRFGGQAAANLLLEHILEHGLTDRPGIDIVPDHHGSTAAVVYSVTSWERSRGITGHAFSVNTRGGFPQGPCVSLEIEYLGTDDDLG